MDERCRPSRRTRKRGKPAALSTVDLTERSVNHLGGLPLTLSDRRREGTDHAARLDECSSSLNGVNMSLGRCSGQSRFAATCLPV